MQCFGTDVKRLLASVTVTVNEGNVIGFEPQEPYIENTSTGQRIPTCKKNSTFPVQRRPTKSDEPNESEKTQVFRQREQRCKRGL